MNRRTFICSTGITALGSLLPDLAFATDLPNASTEPQPFEWSTPELTFAYELSEQKLRQKFLMPAGLYRGRLRPWFRPVSRLRFSAAGRIHLIRE